MALALLAAGPKNSDINPPYKDLKWGMTPQKSSISGLEQYPQNDIAFKGWHGALLGDDVAVFGRYTPKTLRLWSVSVVAGRTVGFDEANSKFEHYLDILTQKYGKPTKDYRYFIRPYEEGDGYEDTALSSEKYRRVSFWVENPVGMLSIEITKEGWTKMSYESREFFEVQKEESGQITKEIL